MAQSEPHEGESTDTGGAGDGNIACDDGQDNDNDGLVDGSNDPGCTKPYDKDDSESNVYDLDASWVFSGKEAPTERDPSIFYGWKVVQEGNNKRSYPDLSTFEERYVFNATDNWGGGRIEEANINYNVHTDRPPAQGSGVVGQRNGYPEIKGSPSQGYCGDGLKNDGGPEICPHDYGFKENIELDRPGFTHDGNTVRYDVGADTNSNLDNSADFELVEANGTEKVGQLDRHQRGNISADGCFFSCHYANSSFLGPSDNKDILLEEEKGDSGNWDFYRSSSDSNVIMGAHGTKTQSSLPGFPVQDDDLAEEHIRYVDAKVYENGGEPSSTKYKVYPGGGTDENPQKREICTSYRMRDVYSLRDITETETFDLQEISAETREDLGAEIVKQGGDELSDYQLTVKYSYDEAYVVGQVAECTNWEQHVTSCNSAPKQGITCNSFKVTGYASYDANKEGSVAEGIDHDAYIAVKDSGEAGDIEYVDWQIEEKEILDVDKQSSESEIFHGLNTAYNNYKTQNVEFSRVSGSGYFFPRIEPHNRQGGNNPAVSSNGFRIRNSTASGSQRFVAERNELTIADADGPDGDSDGYASARTSDPGNNINGFTQDFLGTETAGGSSSNYIGIGNVPTIDCPGDKRKCVASVGVKTIQDGWRTLSNSFGFSLARGTYATDVSLGVCEMYRALSGDDTTQCQYNDVDDGDDGGPTDPGTRSCGDDPGERWTYMEGPEVNKAVVTQNPGDQQACATEPTQCVVNGKVVPEGTVTNIVPEDGKNYEKGGNSPDWEVCLAIQRSVDENSNAYSVGDYEDWDNDGQKEETGGEWYDLDNERINQYLRRAGSDLVNDDAGQPKANNERQAETDSNGISPANASDIDFYWKENPNPYDAVHNPTGQGSGDANGVAIEDDCDSELAMCNDQQNNMNRNPLFFGWFEDMTRDEDYNPQGRDQAISPNVPGQGYLIKLKDDSNQLEPGMDTSSYNMIGSSSGSTVDIWFGTRGGTDYADQYGYVESPREVIDNRGKSHDPGRTYYRDSSDRRPNTESSSVSKEEKVFGNSLAVVAGQSFTAQNGVPVEPGEGYWIDPDDVKQKYQSGEISNSDPAHPNGWWQDLVNWNIDLTGPDSGLGWDDGSSHLDQDYDTKSQGGEPAVIRGGVYWEGEGEPNPGVPSDTTSRLEPPMCGDDRKEFFVEEMGESVNSKQYNGRYACADARNVCPNFGEYAQDKGKRIYSTTEYVNADEPDEDVGRLKLDREMCLKDNSIEQPKWYDQDYGWVNTPTGRVQTCRENNLYGPVGVRWITPEYVNNHPNAVTGGIDDDWNAYLEQEEADNQEDSIISRPWKESWTTGETSVPTGSNNRTEPNSNGNSRNQMERKVATLGFCGGDDSAEYLITQRCNTDLCSTDNSVKGVAGDPDKCILEGSRVNAVSAEVNQERDIYDEGETVRVDRGSETEVMACFDGVWQDKWPVNFLRDDVTVPLGGEDLVAFQVINVEDEASTFELELSIPNNDLRSFTSFDKTGTKEMTTTVAASSSKTFNVRIRGVKEVNPAQIEIIAESQDGSLEGSDTMQVSIKNMSINNQAVSGQTRDVPGIGTMQILWLALIASTFYFLTLSRQP
ncbi:MAG: hypothetical protein ABEK16_06695 [Candidatus Nanohalobium sp.]